MKTTWYEYRPMKADGSWKSALRHKTTSTKKELKKELKEIGYKLVPFSYKKLHE